MKSRKQKRLEEILIKLTIANAIAELVKAIIEIFKS